MLNATQQVGIGRNGVPGDALGRRDPGYFADALGAGRKGDLPDDAVVHAG